MLVGLRSQIAQARFTQSERAQLATAGVLTVGLMDATQANHNDGDGNVTPNYHTARMSPSEQLFRQVQAFPLWILDPTVGGLQERRGFAMRDRKTC